MTSSDTPEYGYASAAYHTPPYLLTPVINALGSVSLDVLDIGCGNGFAAAQVAALGHRVTAVDASHSGINVAGTAFSDSGVRYEVASVYDAAAYRALGKFDVVYSIEVIEHLQYPRELFARASEVLKPGGRLLITTPYHGYLKNLVLSLTNGWDRHFAVEWDTGHVRFFSPRSMRAMANAAGFTPGRWQGLGRAAGLWKSFLYECVWPLTDQVSDPAEPPMENR